MYFGEIPFTFLQRSIDHTLPRLGLLLLLHFGAAIDGVVSINSWILNRVCRNEIKEDRFSIATSPGQIFFSRLNVPGAGFRQSLIAFIPLLFAFIFNGKLETLRKLLSLRIFYRSENFGTSLTLSVR